MTAKQPLRGMDEVIVELKNLGERDGSAFREALGELRELLRHGDALSSQAQLDAITTALEPLKMSLRPGEGDKKESFILVDALGRPRELGAPRWLCHLLGLRHRAVHVLLEWQSRGLGPVFVLQRRSWEKSDSPAHLDISVGGHVTQELVDTTAYREMEEERGVVREHLCALTEEDRRGWGINPTCEPGPEPTLLRLFAYEGYNERPTECFHNDEWSEVFLARLSTDGLENIRFADGEVAGVELCPRSEAGKLLGQNLVPVARALRGFLEECRRRGLL